MKQFSEGSSSLLILERGEELIESLETFAAQQELTAGWLSGGLGGADKLTIGFYDIEAKDYEWRTYDEPLEILSLTGNVVIVDGRPFWHVHGVFSGRDFGAFGGHVKELVIGLTGELQIASLPTSLTRQYDSDTGLRLICPAG